MFGYDTMMMSKSVSSTLLMLMMIAILLSEQIYPATCYLVFRPGFEQLLEKGKLPPLTGIELCYGRSEVMFERPLHFDSREAGFTNLFDPTMCNPADPIVHLLKAMIDIKGGMYDEAKDRIDEFTNVPHGRYLKAFFHALEGPQIGELYMTGWHNAKFWYRMAGRHPVLKVCLEEARRLVCDDDIPLSDLNDGGKTRDLMFHMIDSNKWHPARYLDACAAAVASNDQKAMRVLEQIRETEFDALMDVMVKKHDQIFWPDRPMGW